VPDPRNAELYRRLRPLVEQSALAIADVVAELDRLAPKSVPGAEKAAGSVR
jgi:gluconokinase